MRCWHVRSCLFLATLATLAPGQSYVLAMPSEVPDDVIIHGVLLQKQDEPVQYAKRYEEIELEGGTTLILDRRTNRIQAMETLAKMLDEAELADGKPATFITLDEETVQLLREDTLLPDTARRYLQPGSILYIQPTIAVNVNGRRSDLGRSFASSPVITQRLVEASANAHGDHLSDQRDNRGRGVQILFGPATFTFEGRSAVSQQALAAVFEREAEARETLARSFYELFEPVSGEVFEEIRALGRGTVTLGQLPPRLRQELADSLRVSLDFEGFESAAALEEFLSRDENTIQVTLGVEISVPTPSSPGNIGLYTSYISIRLP